MTETRAILFDLDGTLIDTTDLILQCFAHTWSTVCGESHSREAILETFGIPLPVAMRQLLAASKEQPELDPDDPGVAELIDRLLTEYRSFNVANHDTLAQPFDGTERALAELRDRGYLIGVVTSKGRDLAARGLRLCALDALIDVAVFHEDTDLHKPRPEPILAALNKLNLTPNNAVYVGDSPHDLVAGRAAGVKTIAALWGPSPRAQLEREQPDHMAGSISDLLQVFV